MTCFVLRTEDDDDLGFLMFASHDGDWPPAGVHDCVFSGLSLLPKALRDDPRSLFVSEHKGAEWPATIAYSDTEMTVRIALPAGAFELRSTAEGNAWSARRNCEALQGTGAFL